MGKLEVEQGKSVYYEHHRGDGPTVVLVHGWGMTCRIWDLNLPALLEAGHAVVQHDHRSCGLSDKDFDDNTTVANASDVVALVRHAGGSGTVLVGWSYGAAISAQAAAELGDELAGLVLVGPPTPRFSQTDDFPHGGTEEALTTTFAGLRDDRPTFLRGLCDAVCHTPPGQAVVEWMWEMFMQTSPRADQGLKDLAQLDHRALLPTVTVPTLLVSGTQDVVVDPAIAGVAAELLPTSKLSKYDASGHAPFLDERERFNAELVAFAADPARAVRESVPAA